LGLGPARRMKMIGLDERLLNAESLRQKTIVTYDNNRDLMTEHDEMTNRQTNQM
jgi:hypothetical protein